MTPSSSFRRSLSCTSSSVADSKNASTSHLLGPEPWPTPSPRRVAPLSLIQRCSQYLRVMDRAPGLCFYSAEGDPRMDDNTLVDSSVSATIHAPIESVDIPSWCFTLAEAEYQGCSPAHCSAGTTTSPDGRRMSINVEIIGGSL